MALARVVECLDCKGTFDTSGGDAPSIKTAAGLVESGRVRSVHLIRNDDSCISVSRVMDGKIHIMFECRDCLRLTEAGNKIN